MNATHLLSDRMMDDILPLAGVLLGCSLVVLPALAMTIARKWSSAQPQLSTGILGGTIAITLFGIFTSAFVFLALIGWIPPLGVLLGRTG